MAADRRPSAIAVLCVGLASCLLVGCAEAGRSSQCLEHYQTNFGNQTKWVPCPAPHPNSPWKQGGL
jgi:hypothetical protein